MTDGMSGSRGTAEEFEAVVFSLFSKASSPPYCCAVLLDPRMSKHKTFKTSPFHRPGGKSQKSVPGEKKWAKSPHQEKVSSVVHSIHTKDILKTSLSCDYRGYASSGDA